MERKLNMIIFTLVSLSVSAMLFFFDFPASEAGWVIFRKWYVLLSSGKQYYISYVIIALSAILLFFVARKHTRARRTEEKVLLKAHAYAGHILVVLYSVLMASFAFGSTHQIEHIALIGVVMWLVSVALEIYYLYRV